MLACALGDSRFRVAVLEAGTVPSFETKDNYQLRVSALSIASHKMLESVGGRPRQGWNKGKRPFRGGRIHRLRKNDGDGAVDPNTRGTVNWDSETHRRRGTIPAVASFAGGRSAAMPHASDEDRRRLDEALDPVATVSAERWQSQPQEVERGRLPRLHISSALPNLVGTEPKTAQDRR